MRHIWKVTWEKCHVFHTCFSQLILRARERRRCLWKLERYTAKPGSHSTDFWSIVCVKSYRPSNSPRSLCIKTLGLIAFMRLVFYTIFGVWMHFCHVTFSWNSMFLAVSMPYLSKKRSKQWYFYDYENLQIKQNNISREVLEKIISGPDFLKNDRFGTSLENG